MAAGGWGWVFGDEGSASVLVRDAVRAVLREANNGRCDDPLVSFLLPAVGVADLAELTDTLSWRGGAETWAHYAPAVGQAARAGSPLAARVIADKGAELARFAATLHQRGAAGHTVAPHMRSRVTLPRLERSTAGVFARSPQFRPSPAPRSSRGSGSTVCVQSSVALTFGGRPAADGVLLRHQVS